MHEFSLSKLLQMFSYWDRYQVCQFIVKYHYNKEKEKIFCLQLTFTKRDRNHRIKNILISMLNISDDNYYCQNDPPNLLTVTCYTMVGTVYRSLRSVGAWAKTNLNWQVYRYISIRLPGYPRCLFYLIFNQFVRNFMVGTSRYLSAHDLL